MPDTDTPAAIAAPKPRRVDADAPWLGLLAFTEETQRFFFGRDAEIREIFLRVRDCPLTVLYGQSGYGKTSLLSAGLIPKLRADRFRPVLLRLRFEKQDPSLVEQVRAALATACSDESTTAADLLARWGAATLWECFHHPALRVPRLESAAPVLIFDQFEEIFTLGATQRTRAEVETLATELADLLENRPPASVQSRLAEDLELASELDFAPSPLRLIITLREDYLSHFEAWKGAMPALMRNRMDLHLLRGPQALEAVVRPGRLDGRNLVSDEVGAQIVRVIARRAPDTALEEIEAVPPLLSLLCDELNRARESAPAITAELVEQRHGDILQEFYARCFEGFPPAVRIFVEDRLVSRGGHRNLFAREDAEAELKGADVSEPAAVLDKLLERRLLSVEDRGGTQRIEITHDVLSPLVTASRDERTERERIQRLEAKRRAAADVKRDARERRRLRWLAGAAGIAALLAIVGMIAGFAGSKRAIKQREIAIAQSDLARTQEYRAKESTRVAEEALSLAESKRAETEQARSVAEGLRTEAENLTKKLQIISANQFIRQNRIQDARQILFSIPPEVRDWEWGFLMQLCGPKAQDLADFSHRESGDRTAMMTELLSQKAGIELPPKESRANDWQYESASKTGSLIAYWQGGGRQGTYASFTRRTPKTELLKFRTELYGELEGIRFSNDDSLAFVGAGYFRTNFGETVSLGTDEQHGVAAISLPERFDLRKLGPSEEWFTHSDIHFSDNQSVAIIGPENDRGDQRIALGFVKEANGYQIVPPKTIKNQDPSNDLGLAWLDDDIKMSAGSKKLWRSKFSDTKDGLGRALGDHFEMDGRECVTVIKSNDTVEIWSVADATLRLSFGKPNGEHCFNDALLPGPDGVYDRGLTRRPGGCILAAAATVNLAANKILACPIGGGCVIFDLKTREQICVLLDPKGKPIAIGATEPAAWLKITAQIDPNGEFVAVRETGRNDEGFGIWDAKTGQPIFLSGGFPNQHQSEGEDSDEEVKKVEWQREQITGLTQIMGISWTPDGRQVVIVNEEGEVFIKGRLLDRDVHRLAGANLADALEDRAEQDEGRWSPVKFPARFLSDERLLAGNYIIDNKTWTVLLELPRNAEISPDNAIVATWTDAGELELCDMSFWRAYHGGSTEPLRLREQVLLWQVQESDKAAASGPPH